MKVYKLVMLLFIANSLLAMEKPEQIELPYLPSEIWLIEVLHNLLTKNDSLENAIQDISSLSKTSKFFYQNLNETNILRNIIVDLQKKFKTPMLIIAYELHKKGFKNSLLAINQLLKEPDNENANKILDAMLTELKTLNISDIEKLANSLRFLIKLKYPEIDYRLYVLNDEAIKNPSQNLRLIKLLDQAGYQVLPSYFLNADNLEEIKLILNQNINVDQAGRYGYSPLRNAIAENQPEVVKALLQAGANPNQLVEDERYTLFDLAGNHPEIIRLLLEAGANPELKNSYGDTPLYTAVNNNRPEIVRILLQAGANPHQRTEQGYSLLQITDNEQIKNLLKQVMGSKN